MMTKEGTSQVNFMTPGRGVSLSMVWSYWYYIGIIVKNALYMKFKNLLN